MPALPQVAMPFVRLLYQFWLDNGVPRSALDNILRIDIESDKHVRFGISSAQLSLLHQEAIDQTGDLSLGIKLGQYIAQADLTLSNILLSAETLELGIKTMMEHSRVVSESGYFTLNLSTENNYCLKFIPHKDVIFSNHQKNMVFSAIARCIESTLPQANQMMRYHYDSDITDIVRYESLIHCELVKDDQVYLELSLELMHIRNPSFDRSVFQHNLKQIQKVLIKRNQRLELYSKVREAIKVCLLERKATQENVASMLNLSVRNLQRRLKEAGTSYQVILDDSREELAMSLLKNDEIPLYEVAFLVGFTEPSAFYKAFRRWTGKRPGDFRQGEEAKNINEASGVDVLPC